MDFERRPRYVRELPLTALIDVVFILIIFFMLTTSFLKIESMELVLPSAGSKSAAKNADVARIVIYNNDSITLSNRIVDVGELDRTLQSFFSANPNRRVVVFTDNEVSMQKLVSVMDMITLAGGKSLYVRPLENPTPPTATPMEKPGGV